MTYARIQYLLSYRHIRYGTIGRTQTLWLRGPRVAGDFTIGTVRDKWPGNAFDNEGELWKCQICGQEASRGGGIICSRQTVRRYHTIARCAMGLRLRSEEVRQKAMAFVERLGRVYLQPFIVVLRPTVPRMRGSVMPPENPRMAPRARSRSPVFAEGGT